MYDDEIDSLTNATTETTPSATELTSLSSFMDSSSAITATAENSDDASSASSESSSFAASPTAEERKTASTTTRRILQKPRNDVEQQISSLESTSEALITSPITAENPLDDFTTSALEYSENSRILSTLTTLIYVPSGSGSEQPSSPDFSTETTSSYLDENTTSGGFQDASTESGAPSSGDESSSAPLNLQSEFPTDPHSSLSDAPVDSSPRSAANSLGDQSTTPHRSSFDDGQITATPTAPSRTTKRIRRPKATVARTKTRARPVAGRAQTVPKVMSTDTFIPVTTTPRKFIAGTTGPSTASPQIPINESTVHEAPAVSEAHVTSDAMTKSSGIASASVSSPESSSESSSREGSTEGNQRHSSSHVDGETTLSTHATEAAWESTEKSHLTTTLDTHAATYQHAPSITEGSGETTAASGEQEAAESSEPTSSLITTHQEITETSPSHHESPHELESSSGSRAEEHENIDDFGENSHGSSKSADGESDTTLSHDPTTTKEPETTTSFTTASYSAQEENIDSTESVTTAASIEPESGSENGSASESHQDTSHASSNPEASHDTSSSETSQASLNSIAPDISPSIANASHALTSRLEDSLPIEALEEQSAVDLKQLNETTSLTESTEPLQETESSTLGEPLEALEPLQEPIESLDEPTDGLTEESLLTSDENIIENTSTREGLIPEDIGENAPSTVESLSEEERFPPIESLLRDEGSTTDESSSNAERLNTENEENILQDSFPIDENSLEKVAPLDDLKTKESSIGDVSSIDKLDADESLFEETFPTQGLNLEENLPTEESLLGKESLLDESLNTTESLLEESLPIESPKIGETSLESLPEGLDGVENLANENSILDETSKIEKSSEVLDDLTTRDFPITPTNLDQLELPSNESSKVDSTIDKTRRELLNESLKPRLERTRETISDESPLTTEEAQRTSATLQSTEEESTDDRGQLENSFDDSNPSSDVDHGNESSMNDEEEEDNISSRHKAPLNRGTRRRNNPPAFDQGGPDQGVESSGGNPRSPRRGKSRRNMMNSRGPLLKAQAADLNLGVL